MITFEGIEENFRFIVVETQRQLRNTLDFLKSPAANAYGKIISRDDYIDNLKSVIENQCFAKIHTDKKIEKHDINKIRAIHLITVNLERVADNCVNIVGQTEYLTEPQFLHRFDYEDLFQELLESIDYIYPSLKNGDMSQALSICMTENEIDRMYKINFDKIMAMLQQTREVQDLITALFIFRYLERMGDSLLNVGEALLFAKMGERIKIHQFQSLQQVLSASGFQGSMSDIDYSSIQGTRSGCNIGKVQNDSASGTYSQEGIFKEGHLNKMKAEKESLEEWGRILPGLTPRVLSYQEEERVDKASVLVQFIPGHTLDEVVLHAEVNLLNRAMESLKNTLSTIWEKTREAGPIDSDYVDQIRDRVKTVCSVHPEFCRYDKSIGNARIRSSYELFDICSKVEKEIKADQSVRIHGDFNISNIIYNLDHKTVHFLDVYRSRQADYIQDCSVFIISNFRTPIFERKLRNRLNWIIENFFSFITDTARKWEDRTFDVRMALALARSFYTSTRFELHYQFAKEMFMRAHYLLEKVLRHSQEGAPWEEFELPGSVLYY